MVLYTKDGRPIFVETWDDVLPTKQEPRREAMIYVCDCYVLTSTGKRQLMGQCKEVKVDAEGLCLKCRHYAWTVNKRTHEAYAGLAKNFSKKRVAS